MEERDPVTGEWQPKRSPAALAALQRKRARPSYTLLARQAAARRLELELGKLDRRRPCEPRTWSPRKALAGALGVSSKRLGRWLDAGAVPEGEMPNYVSWAEAALQDEQATIAEKGRAERLIEDAKRPGYGHSVKGQGRRPARRTPDVRDGESLYDSQEASGYEWRLRVESWCSFELITELAQWAASRVRPAQLLARPARFWLVTALCTVLVRKNGKSPRSPGGYRQFARESDRAVGNRLSIGAPVSSRTVRHGGLARAVRLFREQMTVEFCENETLWVHGLLVRNWRHRGSRERKAYASRAWAHAKAENAARLRKEERRKAKARKKTRGKVQGRAKARAKERRSP